MALPWESGGGGRVGAAAATRRRQESNVLAFVRQLVVKLNSLRYRFHGGFCTWQYHEPERLPLKKQLLHAALLASVPVIPVSLNVG